MRVSAAQFFAMSEEDRKLVTHIDMDLDREAERRSMRGAASYQRHSYDPDPAEPGTDWINPRAL